MQRGRGVLRAGEDPREEMYLCRSHESLQREYCNTMFYKLNKSSKQTKPLQY